MINENIISERISAQKEKSFSIKNTIEIGECKISFAERSFLFGFSMVVPENFDFLDEESARRKYPNENRPKIIISNVDTSVNISFNKGIIATNSIGERLQIYKTVIKRLYPSNVFFSQKIYDISEKLGIACYDFRSTALDCDMYNLNFFTDLPDGEIMGWFNCPIELKDKWEPLVRQMIQTIKPLPQEEQE